MVVKCMSSLQSGTKEAAAFLCFRLSNQYSWFLRLFLGVLRLSHRPCTSDSMEMHTCVQIYGINKKKNEVPRSGTFFILDCLCGPNGQFLDFYKSSERKKQMLVKLDQLISLISKHLSPSRSYLINSGAYLAL